MSRWQVLLWVFLILQSGFAGRKKKLPDPNDPSLQHERNTLARFFGAPVEPPPHENPEPPENVQQPTTNDPLESLLNENTDVDEQLAAAEHLLNEHIGVMEQIQEQHHHEEIERPVQVLEEDISSDDEPPAKRRPKSAKRLAEKWKADDRYCVFDIDISSDHYKCTVCEKAGSTCALADWQPFNWKNAVNSFKQHLGLKKKGKTRGAEHAKSVVELERRKLEEDLKHRNQRRLIEGIEKGAAQSSKVKEQQAATLLQIVMFVGEHGYSINSFYSLRDWLQGMITQMAAGVQNDVSDLISTFDNLMTKLQELEDSPLKSELIGLASKAKEQALRAIQRALPDPHQVASRVTTGSEVNKIVGLIGTALLDLRLSNVKESPAISLLIDESTDNAKYEQLVMNILYVADGVKRSVFIGLVHLIGTTAQQIFDSIVSFFTTYGLDFGRLYGFGSDGAANMRGSENGVARKLKDLCTQHCIALHCVCHNTALSARAGVESSSLGKLLDALIRTIAADFGRSTHQNEQLREIQKIFNTKTKKTLRIAPFHAVRWLSRYESVERIVRLMQSLLTHYEVLARDQHPRYGQLTDYRLIRFLYAILDILEPLKVITKTTESKIVTITKVRRVIDTQIAVLESLKQSPGYYEQLFLNTEVIVGGIEPGGRVLRSQGVPT